MKDTCTLEKLYAIGQLKACPYISEPVLNNYGWLMNPMNEKYQLSEGHIFLFPEEINREWFFRWIIFKAGAGSCGATKPDLYIMAYTKAIDEILIHRRISEKDKLEIKEIFENKFDSRRTFLEDKTEIKEIPKEIKEYVSPFENKDFGKIGNQLDLF